MDFEYKSLEDYEDFFARTYHDILERSNKLNEAMGSLEDYEDFFGNYNDIIRMVKKGEISKERGEEIIKTNPGWAYNYAKYVIKGRWPEGEEIIKTDPGWAYWYARVIIGNRWLEAEDEIKKDRIWWKQYKKDFNINSDVIAYGNCFRYALDYARNVLNTNKEDNVMIVHAVVDPATGSLGEHFQDQPPYDHAWVEHDGIVYDWQTMEGGHGGIYHKKGWPVSRFREVYNPKDEKRYTPLDAVKRSIREGHLGPWE